jgi:hypothetical protein
MGIELLVVVAVGVMMIPSAGRGEWAVHFFAKQNPPGLPGGATAASEA